jgi:hypothetical protein
MLRSPVITVKSNTQAMCGYTISEKLLGGKRKISIYNWNGFVANQEKLKAISTVVRTCSCHNVQLW